MLAPSICPPAPNSSLKNTELSAPVIVLGAGCLCCAAREGPLPLFCKFRCEMEEAVCSEADAEADVEAAVEAEAEEAAEAAEAAEE